MKRILAISLTLTALLMLPACQKENNELAPGETKSQEPASKTDSSVPVFIVGDNIVLFGYENAGSPNDPGEIEGMWRPSWIDLEDSRDTGEYSKMMRFDDDESLKQHYRLEYDPIDWSKKTLLLAYGMRLNQDHPWSAHFEEKGDGEYVLTVEIVPSIFTALNWWRVAVLVDKLDENADIELSTIN